MARLEEMGATDLILRALCLEDFSVEKRVRLMSPKLVALPPASAGGHPGTAPTHATSMSGLGRREAPGATGDLEERGA